MTTPPPSPSTPEARSMLRTRFTPEVFRLEGRIAPSDFVPSPVPPLGTIPPPPGVVSVGPIYPITSDQVYDPSVGAMVESVSLPYRMQDGVLKPLIQVVEP